MGFEQYKSSLWLLSSNNSNMKHFKGCDILTLVMYILGKSCLFLMGNKFFLLFMKLLHINFGVHIFLVKFFSLFIHAVTINL